MTKTRLILKAVIGNYGSTRALKDGTVAAPEITLDFVEFFPVHKAFRPMIQRLEFDVSEMPFTTYMLAKSFNKQLTALPIVLVRRFHHGTILCNVRSGIREPKDLEGRRVGMRAYAQKYDGDPESWGLHVPGGGATGLDPEWMRLWEAGR